MRTEKTFYALTGEGFRNRCYERGCRTPVYRAELCRFHYEQQQAREAQIAGVRRERGGFALSKRRCHVYAVSAPNGLIKIGSALNPEERLDSLQGQSPIKVELKLLGSMRGNRDLERTIHRRLAAYREHGEWFRNEGDVTRVVEAIVARDGEALIKMIVEMRSRELAVVADNCQT